MPNKKLTLSRDMHAMKLLHSDSALATISFPFRLHASSLCTHKRYLRALFAYMLMTHPCPHALPCAARPHASTKRANRKTNMDIARPAKSKSESIAFSLTRACMPVSQLRNRQVQPRILVRFLHMSQTSSAGVYALIRVLPWSHHQSLTLRHYLCCSCEPRRWSLHRCDVSRFTREYIGNMQRLVCLITYQTAFARETIVKCFLKRNQCMPDLSTSCDYSSSVVLLFQNDAEFSRACLECRSFIKGLSERRSNAGNTVHRHRYRNLLEALPLRILRIHEAKRQCACEYALDRAMM